MWKKPWLPALLVALLGAALKLVIVLAPGPAVSPSWVLPEELHRGNIAQEILDGPLLPLFDYHHAPNVGGSLVVGVLAVPLFALFGSSLFVLRLVPILFHVASVFLLFLILDRWVSRRAAWIGALLLAVAYPGYSLIAITAWGTHCENNALTLLALWLYLGLAPTQTKSLARAWCFGAVAGFATYFGYLWLLALAAMFAFEFTRDRRFVLRPWFGIFASGFLVGLLPWMAYNLTHGFAGLEVYNEPVSAHLGNGNTLAAVPGRAFELAGSYLPDALFFRSAPANAAFALALLAFVLLGLWRWAREPRAALACAAIYAGLFVLAFVWVDVGQYSGRIALAHDGRYAAALFPFGALLAGAGLDHAWNSRVLRATLGLVLAAGVAGLFPVCDFGHFGESLRTEGHSTRRLAQFFTWKYRTDPGRLERIVQGLEERRSKDVQDEMLFTLGTGYKATAVALAGKPDPTGRARREESARVFMERRVAPQLRPYFEPLRQGERLLSYRERKTWWMDYRAWRTEELRNQAVLTPPRASTGRM